MTSLDQMAKAMCRPRYLVEHMACADCQHFLTFRIHPDLRLCCACGHTVPLNPRGVIIREAFK